MAAAAAEEDDAAERELLRCWKDLVSCPPPLSDLALAQLHRAVKSMGPPAAPLLLRFLRLPDLPDPLLDALAQSIALCCGSCSAPPSTLTIAFPPSIHVNIKEMDYVRGGLGWKVWGAALLLSTRLIHLQKSLYGKRVLELGSGCGLTGLLVAKLGASEVVMSDCVPGILENLCDNILLLPARTYLSNDKEVTLMENATLKFDYIYEGTELESLEACPCIIRVRMVDWLEDGSLLLREEDPSFPKLTADDKFDWVIGSDLIYNQYNIKALANVINRRLQKDGMGLFAAPVRDILELRVFTEELNILGMDTDVENCTEQEWEACMAAMAAERDRGSTLYGVDHYEGGVVLIIIKHKTQLC